MALVNVVKCTINNTKELVVKFPSEDLRLGTQLVVYPGQTALFLKGGKIYDVFESGTYTLKTSNIPLLNQIINLPFGSQSPFQAEVWFVNQVTILDSKWGTATPLQIEDPKYQVIVPVRAYGQYGFQVSDAEVFMNSLLGNMTSFTIDKLNQYFRGKIMSQLTNILSDKLTKDNISVLNINSHLEEISNFCQSKISEFFQRYGLNVQSFDVISISVKEDDPSFTKLKEAKDLAAHLKITGRDVYQMERSFNVLDTAAANESGAAGNLMNAGIGLGVGFNMGNQVGNITQQLDTNPSPSTLAPPPLVNNIQYFLAINGQQQGPFNLSTIASFILNRSIVANTLVWKQGMSGWANIQSLPEFSQYFMVPPPIPK